MDNDIQQKGQRKYELWQPFLLSVMMVIGMLLGYKMNDRPDALATMLDGSDKLEIGRVEEILRLIETRYVDHVDRDKLIENAIHGMLDELDPHSVYLQKEYLTDVNDHMDGNFKGIGIESHMLRDTAVIIKVVDDSPAAKVGLKPFDKIIQINGRKVAGVKMPFDSLRYHIRQKEDAVQMEILQKQTGKLLLKNIKTEEIPIHSADISYLLNDSTAYIQIKQFSSNTYTEFMAAFEEWVDKNKAKHLVIDLRGNPGGYLPQATKIVNQLIREKKQLIVSTKDKNGNSEEYFTTGHSFFNVGKIAVLVDENSASGSEVIAGAIQDHDRGMIIGHTTYGKGLVQEQFNLSNGAAIRLTTARYYTPSGRSIQKEYDKSGNQKDANLQPKIYETLQLKRKVRANSGIEPDFVIESDTNSQLAYQQYMVRNDVLDFVLKKFLSGEIRQVKGLDYGQLTAAFKLQNINKSLSAVPDSIITTAIKNEVEYLSTNGNDKAVSRLAASDDAYIQAALKYVSGKLSLK